MTEKVSDWIINCPRLTSREEIAARVVELESDNAALKAQLDDTSEERRYTLKEIKEMYLPDRDLASLRSISEEWVDKAPKQDANDGKI